MVAWIILIIVGYLIGSIPLSYLVGKRRGVDLRKHGTRQVGGGNLWRMTSRRWGLLVGFFDFIKGILLVGVARNQGLDAGQQLVVGLAVIVGHNWPVFLRFHGGRGIATLMGILVIMPILNRISPWPSVMGIGIGVVFTVIFRTSPLPVLAGVASVPLTTWLFHGAVSIIIAFLAIFLVVVVKRLTAQPMPEGLKVGRGRLLFNRLIFDRDIADRRAWLGRKHFDEKEILE